MDFYWITQLGDADFCPPVKDISVAHFLLIHCSCSHASRLVIHIAGAYISQNNLQKKLHRRILNQTNCLHGISFTVMCPERPKLHLNTSERNKDCSAMNTQRTTHIPPNYNVILMSNANFSSKLCVKRFLLETIVCAGVFVLPHTDAISNALDDRYRFKVVYKQN